MKIETPIVLCVPNSLHCSRVRMQVAVGKHHNVLPSQVWLFNLTQLQTNDLTIEGMMKALEVRLTTGISDKILIIVRDNDTMSLFQAANAEGLLDFTVEWYDVKTVFPPDDMPPPLAVSQCNRGRLSYWHRGSVLGCYDTLLDRILDWT